MSKLGFRCFTSPEMPVPLTLRQQVVALTDAQRQALLDGFTNRIPSAHLDHQILLSKELIDYVYNGIDAIEETSRLLMRGEYVTTPAVTHIDPITGNIIIDTPAIYAPVPTTAVLLRQAIAPLFVADYPILFCSNAVNAMVSWSKYDGSGTFAFYKSQIIL
jgi:hypothetical protein